MFNITPDSPVNARRIVPARWSSLQLPRRRAAPSDTVTLCVGVLILRSAAGGPGTRGPAQQRDHGAALRIARNRESTHRARDKRRISHVGVTRAMLRRRSSSVSLTRGRPAASRHVRRWCPAPRHGSSCRVQRANVVRTRAWSRRAWYAATQSWSPPPCLPRAATLRPLAHQTRRPRNSARGCPSARTRWSGVARRHLNAHGT